MTDKAPIEVSERCYKEVEDYLEGIYDLHPFRRIIKNGKYLGYQGFIDNYDLHVEDLGDSIMVSLVAKASEEARYVQTFEK